MGCEDGRIVIEVEQDLMPVVPEYLEGRRHDCAGIVNLLASNDLDGLRFLAHRMKGSGGSFGFDGISEIGEKLERALKSTDTAAVRILAAELEEYLDRVEVHYI